LQKFRETSTEVNVKQEVQKFLQKYSNLNVKFRNFKHVWYFCKYSVFSYSPKTQSKPNLEAEIFHFCVFTNIHAKNGHYKAKNRCF